MMGDMSDKDTKSGSKVTSIFSKQTSALSSAKTEALFEAVRYKYPAGTPLTDAQEEERDWFIGRKNEIFQERLDRGFIGDGYRDYMSEQHESEIQELKSMDRAQWEDLVDRQMIEPLHTSKTAQQEVENYVQEITQSWKDDPAEEGENLFETKREMEEHIFILRNMTVGEWEQAKQTRYILASTLNTHTPSLESGLDSETKATIDKSIGDAMPGHVKMHYDAVLSQFEEGKIETASLMINRMPMGRILGEEGIAQVLQEALENNYVDEFTATKIKNGELIQPSAQEPDGPS